MAEVTTVKLNKRTKATLDELKGERETYDDVISKLVSQVRVKSMKAELAEEYKKLGKDDLRLMQEWETASSELE